MKSQNNYSNSKRDRMNKYKSAATPYVFLALLLLFVSCSLGPFDFKGTGSQAGNGMVLGTVLYEDGSPVVNADVFVRSSRYLKDTSEVSVKRKPDTFTNDSGVFSFESMKYDSYFIEINDNNNNALLLQFKNDNRDKEDSEKTVLEPSAIRPAASLTGKVNMKNLTQPANLYIQIYGLEYVQRLSDSGHFRFPSVPSGTLKLRIISEDTSVGIIESNTVDLQPGEAKDTGPFDFPFTFWRDTAVVRYILDTNNLKNVSVSSVISEVKKGRITKLNFNGKGLSNIPPKIGELELTHLNLGNNYLSSLPKEFKKLTSLEHLDLMRNKFMRIDNSIYSLLNLEHLDISENKVFYLSKDIENLTSLRTFKLDNNKLKLLSSIKGKDKDECLLSKLTNLEILDLSNNKIYKISKEITNLKNLKELYVNNNKLVNVSTEVEQWLDTYSTDNGNWKETQDSTKHQP